MKYYGKEMDSIHPEGCIAMTWEDAEEMAKANHDCGWGFSVPDQLRFIADHMDANYDVKDGNDPLEAYRCMEKIEWRLEDANFHTLCGFLHDHEYIKAIKYIGEEYSDDD